MMALPQYNSEDTKGGGRSDFISDLLPSVDINIVLGMPSKNCQFHGICKIEPPLSQNSAMGVKPNHGIRAILSFNKRKELEILFQKKDLTEKLRAYHFGRESFLVLEPVNIPEFAARALGRGFKVSVGRYPIYEADSFYKINFTG